MWHHRQREAELRSAEILGVCDPAHTPDCSGEPWVLSPHQSDANTASPERREGVLCHLVSAAARIEHFCISCSAGALQPARGASTRLPPVLHGLNNFLGLKAP